MIINVANGTGWSMNYEPTQEEKSLGRVAMIKKAIAESLRMHPSLRTPKSFVTISHGDNETKFMLEPFLKDESIVPVAETSQADVDEPLTIESLKRDFAAPMDDDTQLIESSVGLPDPADQQVPAVPAVPAAPISEKLA